MSLDKYVNLEVNSFLRSNNLDQKMKECIFNDKIDLIEHIEECDVITGDYKLEYFKFPNLPLEGTEQVVYNIGEELINANEATADDVYDIRSTLEYISGSKGRERAYSIVKELNIVSLNLLISWMFVYSRFRFSSVSDLRIAINPNELDQKNIKIVDILDYYFLNQQGKGNLININATVIPIYYWIQQIKEATNI